MTKIHPKVFEKSLDVFYLAMNGEVDIHEKST
jgi:hypothetical protein